MRAKIFGDIPGVKIFARFESRKECSQLFVHRPLLAGIDGNARYGACSIALSGRYEDDKDWGDVIVYTGAGGKIKWDETSHITDQSWRVHPNNAMKTSFLTGKPIRVIRSSNSTSPYAPFNGFRYDGLYQITKCWTAKGRSGWKICRCRLERLPGQPPIPLHPHRFAPTFIPPDESLDSGNVVLVERNATKDDADAAKNSKEKN